jgi:hypothetical protein
LAGLTPAPELANNGRSTKLPLAHGERFRLGAYREGLRAYSAAIGNQPLSELAMTALQPFAQNIWTALAPHSFVGLHIGTRLTVIRLSSGKLLLHSPIPLSVEVRSAIDALGPAARIVCPNLFHHMYAAETAAAYPRTMLQDSECVALTCLIEANKSCDHEEKAFIFAAQGLIAKGSRQMSPQWREAFP